MPTGDPQARARIARRVRTASGQLTSASLARMDGEMTWFSHLTADARSYVGLIVQRGIAAFAEWLEDPKAGHLGTVGPFQVAPREMAGIVNLHQTVALVRLTFRVVEDNAADIVDSGDAQLLYESLLEFAREFAFTTAEVYARAAELRGAWDARLEALLVDSVMRAEGDETVRTRASALGWASTGHVVVVVGGLPDDAGPETSGLIDEVRRSARSSGLDALGAAQGDRLVVVLGGVTDPDKAGASVERHFGAGPVVVGTVVSDLLQAHASARSAVAGLQAAAGWPEAPRPVTAEDLLPERALAGDSHARQQLIDGVYQPLADHGLVETVATFFASGSSIEATARAMFVHANTVRYRLRRVADITGLAPNDARQGFTCRIALVVGRLQPLESTSTHDL